MFADYCTSFEPHSDPEPRSFRTYMLRVNGLQTNIGPKPKIHFVFVLIRRPCFPMVPYLVA